MQKESKSCFNLIYLNGNTFADAALKLNIPMDILKSMVKMAIDQIKGTVVL